MANRPPLHSLGKRTHWTTLAICIGLAGLVLLIYGQTIRFGFVNYDDSTYVYENRNITPGLSVRGIIYAFSHIHSNNWHPLTTITHMLDCQIYGLNAGGHHFTNLILHGTVCILLFLVLRTMTGALWRSAFVAAIFAVHPLHVESVAWISERKDVLSALFFMLTLGAYVRYARSSSVRNYLLVVLLFALGLLSKPMLVTMPFVLLLIDYWPLNRFADRSAIGRLIAEKIPLLLMSVASSAATVVAQHEPLGSNEVLALSWRLSNALSSYAIYLKQSIWPTRLAAYYPIFLEELGRWQVIGAFLLVTAITVSVIVPRRTRPYLFTGWFWYLGMLVPVIGIVQVGGQAHADRYAYLPQIGLAIIAAWGGRDLAERFQIQRKLSLVALAIIAGFVVLAWRQTGVWRTGEALFKQALAATGKNDVAHYGLGDVYIRRGEIERGIEEFRTSLNIRPDQPNAEDYLGLALLKGGHVDEAIEHFDAALALQPNHLNARFNLANALFQKGDVDDAMRIYQDALANNQHLVVSGFVQPDYAAAHYNLGNCYIQRGDLNRAIGEFHEALKLLPESPQAHNNLAFALSQAGQTREAVKEWEQALRSNPKNVELLANLAWTLATSSDSSIRNGRRALDFIQEAQPLSPDDPKILRVLAAARAETGDFEGAIRAANDGVELAKKKGNTELQHDLESDLILYQANTAWHG